MIVRDFDEFLTNLDTAARAPNSPDGLKWGDLEMTVTGVATTWMASMPVLREVAAKGLNLIVTHEPTFWFHGTPDNPELAQCEAEDIDMSFKTDFLTEHGLTVIRAHNCWDGYPEYGIEARLARQLGLPKHAGESGGFHHIYELPPTTLGELAQHCRERMSMPSVRVAGNVEMPVARVSMAYGASSSTRTHYALWKAGVDAVVSGEQQEWPVIRPCIDMGLGVIELGHSNTEAAGMEGLAELLRENFSGVPIEHVPTGDSFSYV